MPHFSIDFYRYPPRSANITEKSDTDRCASPQIEYDAMQ